MMATTPETIQGTPSSNGTGVFEEYESAVRTYCRKFPAVFTTARGHRIWDVQGREYVDFLSGAGALNYGHNHPLLKRALLGYIERDGITHSMDLYTEAKRDFMQAMLDVVLGPRRLSYHMQFTGPTGSNATEAALKVARRITGRTNIVAFTNGFHGMSLGALATTATSMKRRGAGVPLTHVTRMPFDGYFGDRCDTIEYLEVLLGDTGSGIDWPAAFIVETVQGEGGLNSASVDWLRRLADLAQRRGVILIVDDIQAGCGRTGSFFSFEDAGLYPDVVCLSKSISGFGLPMSLVLMKPSLDQQEPGEHSGTFRGNNLAFVTGRAALSLWADPTFQQGVIRRAQSLDEGLGKIARKYPRLGCRAKGRGLMRGLSWSDPTVAGKVSRAAFGRGLLVETSGAQAEVLKLMPALTIDTEALQSGLSTLESAIHDVCFQI